ncbi:MAG: hypothetical protein Q3972_03590 [Corynebacterium sp.]|nr:hypothetical protein [Corynebacterium sp.]
MQTPIETITRNNGGRFSLGASLSAGFSLNFRHWKIWVGFAGACFLVAWIAVGFSFTTLFIAGAAGAETDYDATLGGFLTMIFASPIVAIQLLLGGLVALLLMPLVANAAYRSLFREKLAFKDLTADLPYLRVLLAFVIIGLVHSVCGAIPLIGFIVDIFVSPFFIFLPYAALEKKSFGEAINLASRYYLPVLGLSVVTSIIGAVAWVIFPILFVPVISTAVAYGMLRIEQNASNSQF